MNSDELVWLKARPVAHRGLTSLDPGEPENSLAAFQKALENNFAIHGDVRVMADQEVIVFGDDNIQRLCGRNRDVSTLTRSELDRCRLAGTAERIPLLTEVLEAVDGQAPLLLEVRPQPEVRHANMIILNTLLNYKGEIAIQSTDPFVLRDFARYGPFLTRGQLPGRRFSLPFIGKPHYFICDIADLPSPRWARKRKHGAIVLGQTVKSQDSYQRVSPYCDNIIFEGFCPNGRSPVAR